MGEAPIGLTADELLARARAGDKQALDDLLGRFRDLMKRWAHSRTERSGASDSSDVVQEAQLRVFQRIDQFQGQSISEFCAWLRTIVAHEAIDQRRRGQRRSAQESPQSGSGVELEIAGPGDTPSDVVSRQEEAARVRDALTRLEPEDQDVIRLRDFEGLSYAEIAAVYGVNEAALRKRYARALKRLGNELQ
ncbi:MAG: sigma-70 family RNA polymerase sigma factor [Planctomycetes bacterium]|nr:sigma-70 family RNA polymerase sigma factor [Planctomycetota bacterium]